MNRCEETESTREAPENVSDSGWYIRRYKSECYDEDGEFDWDKYQELCDQADYWDL